MGEDEVLYFQFTYSHTKNRLRENGLKKSSLPLDHNVVSFMTEDTQEDLAYVKVDIQPYVRPMFVGSQ